MNTVGDLNRELSTRYVLGYGQLRGDLNTNDFEAAQGMQRCIVALSNRIDQRQASSWEVHQSVDNIRHALTVFHRHLADLKNQPDQMIAVAGGSTTNRIFYLGAPGVGNTVGNFEQMLQEIAEAADYFEQKASEIERRNDCKLMTKVTCLATAVFAMSYFFMMN